VRSQIQLIDKNFDAPAVPIAELMSPNQPLLPRDEWRSVVVSGTYVPQLQVLARNRTHEGITGFDVLSPLRDEHGILFLVDRGWIPTSEDGRTPAQIPALPQGTVTVVAHLRNTEPVLKGQSDTATLVSSIHVAELAQQWKVSAYTGAYGLLASVSPAGTNGTLSSKPVVSEGNHLSYALQWIAFALLGFIALLWAIRNERRARSGVKALPRKATKSRHPSDSEIEDALLDAQR
jgi:cytochrome oxidase assembly protein ShyY1